LQLEDGKADIALTIDELLTLMPLLWNRRYRFHLRDRDIVVTANVTETATGKTLSGNNTVRCTDRKYVLSFLDITPTSFKPGLSVSVYVRTTENVELNVENDSWCLFPYALQYHSKSLQLLTAFHA